MHGLPANSSGGICAGSSDQATELRTSGWVCNRPRNSPPASWTVLAQTMRQPGNRIGVFGQQIPASTTLAPLRASCRATKRRPHANALSECANSSAGQCFFQRLQPCTTVERLPGERGPHFSNTTTLAPFATSCVATERPPTPPPTTTASYVTSVGALPTPTALRSGARTAASTAAAAACRNPRSRPQRQPLPSICITASSNLKLYTANFFFGAGHTPTLVLKLCMLRLGICKSLLKVAGNKVLQSGYLARDSLHTCNSKSCLQSATSCDTFQTYQAWCCVLGAPAGSQHVSANKSKRGMLRGAPSASAAPVACASRTRLLDLRGENEKKLEGSPLTKQSKLVPSSNKEHRAYLSS